MSTWLHARWFEPHPAVPVEGSQHYTRWGALEAECAACGEALVSAVIRTSPGACPMSAPDDPMTDDQAADAMLDAIAEMRRDPRAELVARLRALIEQWRAVAGGQSIRSRIIGPTIRLLADELEQAIGDGR